MNDITLLEANARDFILWRILAGAMLCCLLLPALAGGQSSFDFPPVPPEGKFAQDYAYLIASDRALNEIEASQHEAFVHHGTPIMLVTISSMARLGGEGYSIERFARAWFDHWNIGRRGMLLLVSRDDRKARIELGTDWGHRFDSRAQRIMNDGILPKFKQGDYSGGLAEGVNALAAMAADGPADLRAPQRAP